jgi:hypothetical protein
MGRFENILLHSVVTFKREGGELWRRQHEAVPTLRVPWRAGGTDGVAGGLTW